ncbi:TAXI family TRAP transporter solute-binding subunit [Heliorestis acidaminivorans]|uniref:TAXI family TRAP transporter solute-binding subunit n=1 Tax=Heliorestis acidaminivorans TaxID=553427 RepID=UPI001FAB2C3C|nr:TAXI family TRAP transporter solute-binding subunit [Heliorestis acidaminivorans]
MFQFLKKKSVAFVATAVLSTSLLLTGCGDSGQIDGKPSSMTIGSASIGGTYYVYAGGMSQIIERATGIPTGVEVTGGPNHNMTLIHNGQLELGLVTMGPAYEAWHGEGDWTNGVEHRNVRVIFPMYNTYSQWWATENSGITGVRDLEGRIVGVGPQGGTAGTYHPRILELLGINATIRHAGISDLVSQHLDGQLHVNSFAAGLPVASVLEMSNQRKIVMFGLDGEDRDKVVTEFPYFTPAVIPASSYDFLTEDVETIGIWNMAVAHKELDDDLVYDIVKAIFDNRTTLEQVHSSASETLMENIDKNTWMWMHPGAIRFFEEQGIELHPDVYPPEYVR